MMSRFLHTLSQFYQGRSPEFGAPTFEKHHFPTPSHSVVAEFWPRMPHLHVTFHSNEHGYAESQKNIEIVRWRIDSRDIEELRSVLSSRRQNDMFLSKHDCLIAYFVSVLNYNRSNPVQKVTSITSVSYSFSWRCGYSPVFSIVTYAHPSSPRMWQAIWY